MDENFSQEPKESQSVPLVKELSYGQEKKPFPLGKIITGVIIVFLGVGTGYVLNQKFGPPSPVTTGKGETPKMIQTNKIVGSTDTKTFRDSATGIIQKDGIDGEGSHKLIREGGESQTAYLTSSVVDLDQFIGKKVKVWGETFKGQKAAWLMDVGKIEIIEG